MWRPNRGRKSWLGASLPSRRLTALPRTDPAVIVLVIDSFSNALLGRRTTWDDTWFSTLAGFVEPGESAESAVVREVGEEVGVEVDPASVQFLGSQPWPFPSSIMLGFHAFARANQGTGLTARRSPRPDGSVEPTCFGCAQAVK